MEGGGIYLEGAQEDIRAGRVQITDSVFARNRAAVSGGAVANEGVAAIRTSRFQDNVATIDGGALATLTGGSTFQGQNVLRSNAPNDIA